MAALLLSLSLVGTSPRSPGQAPLLEAFRPMLGASGHWSTAATLGDVDGDGDLDAWLAHEGDRPLLMNDGAGEFTRAPVGVVPITGVAVNEVLLIDVDGDGDLDAFLAVGQFYSSMQNRLLLNNGAGTFFDATVQLPVDGDYSRGAAAGDVDGDGDLDLLIANGSYGTTDQDRLYLNNGSGVFTDATSQLPVSTSLTYVVALGDVDGDGDLDALFGDGYGIYPGPGALNRLWLNSGNGTFTDASGQLPALSDETVALELGDVDGDGDLDALVGNSIISNGVNRIYVNDGAGTFTLPPGSQLGSGPDWTSAVALADFDQDGDLDALISNSGQTPFALLRLYVNGGGGAFTEMPGLVPSTAIASSDLACADLDQDGDLDVLSSGYPETLLLGDGNGGLAIGNPGDLPTPTAWQAYALAPADFDQDGDLDLFEASREQDRLLLNDGVGSFSVAMGQLPIDTLPTAAVALLDADGNGTLDAFLAKGGYCSLFSCGGTTDVLLLNDGTATFTDASAQLPGLVTVANAAAAGDVDADGDPDLLLGLSAIQAGAQNALLLNAGTGVFTDATAQLPIDTDDTRAVVLEDLNGDGSLDAFLANLATPSRLYLNTGAGLFIDASNLLPPGSHSAWSAAAGDIDGDGDLDILSADGSTARLYLNLGGASFIDASTQLPSVPGAFTTSLADIDEDGDLDALFSGSSWTLALNDGSGTFSDASGLLALNHPGALVLALDDLDADGDLDFLHAGYSGLHRASNLTRHVRTHTLPRFSKPLTFDLRGPHNESFALFASPLPTTIPAPPYGTVFLDIPTLLPLGSGTFGPQGVATLTFLLPPNPGSLSGATLYAQALVGTTSPRLTSRVPVVFTDL